jgi:DNA-binding SARP family transcriptional activator
MLAEHAAIHPRALRIWLLGGLRVKVGDREITGLTRWKRPCSLLAILALAPGHALHREQVQDLLWPQLDACAAANNLHGTLHLLRHVLEPRLVRAGQSSFLVLQSNVLRLRSSAALWIDVEAFELSATAARRSASPSDYEQALELYAGDLLPHDIYLDAIDSHRDALRTRFVVLLQELAALYEQTADAAAAIRTLERLVAFDPADEDASAQLMALFAQRGQRQQALRQYHLLQRALQRDLESRPGLRVEQLRDEILQSHRVVDARTAGDRARLTGRERQIIDLLAHGLTNRRIAAGLGISTRTAETHVSRILRKLDVGSRDQVPLAVAHG